MRTTLLLLALGCGPKAPSTTAPTATPSPTVETASANLPTPYTAEQIRAAMPVGSVLRFRVDAMGEASKELRWKVISSDATGCTMHQEAHHADSGELIDDLGDVAFVWTELRDHAAFPAASATVSSGEVDVPLGHFKVNSYTVRQENGSTVTYHFAPDLPGPPVLMVVIAGEVEVARMSALERSPLHQ